MPLNSRFVKDGYSPALYWWFNVPPDPLGSTSPCPTHGIGDPIPIGTAIQSLDGCARLRTVANGYDCKFNVERTHPQPQTPESNGHAFEKKFEIETVIDTVVQAWRAVQAWRVMLNSRCKIVRIKWPRNELQESDDFFCLSRMMYNILGPVI